MKLHEDPAMMLRSATSEQVLRVNEGCVAALGLSADDLEASPLRDWIHPDDWPAFEQTLAAGSGALHARHRDDSGGWLIFEWQVKTDATGAVVLGRVTPEPTPAAGTAAEDQALPPAKSTGETLTAMALIVEEKNPGLRCSILLLDPETRRVAVGAGPSLPTDYNDAVEGLAIGPAVGSCGTAAFWNVPVVVENIDVDPLWCELRDAAKLAGVKACWSQPITATSGEVLGAMALYSDEPSAPSRSQMDGLEIAARMVGLAIERDRLEAQLREAAKMEAVGRLAGGVAHDFNNLLTIILGHVGLLGAEAVSVNDRERLEAISGAVEHASQITTQLLAYGRKQAHRPEQLDLREVVLDGVVVLDSIIGDDITVSVVSAASPQWVTIDRTQLGQILLNVSLNARDAMPGGGRLEIETREATESEIFEAGAGARPDGFAAVTVTDTGGGMDATTLAQAFEPFYSTKEDGRGTGLGLASVYGLTKQNDGFVFARSEVGEGTAVTILFPRCPSDALPADAEIDDQQRVASVLVAEDSDGIRSLVASILRDEGLIVHEAGDGAEALSLCEDGLAIDLLIADVKMPLVGGIELAAKLGRLHPKAATIYISGYPFEQLDLPRLDPARESYLPKPFTPAQLLEAVRAALPFDEVPAETAAVRAESGS